MRVRLAYVDEVMVSGGCGKDPCFFFFSLFYLVCFGVLVRNGKWEGVSSGNLYGICKTFRPGSKVATVTLHDPEGERRNPG